jgi:alpha-glucuronidase/polygalacturonase
VAEGKNSTVRTAASELREAVEAMFDFKPSVETKYVSGAKVVLGTAETSSWIRKHADELGLDRIKEDGFLIKAVKDEDETILVVAADVPAGVVFGAFDLIRRIQLGRDLRMLDVLENPQIPIRMVDHWAYFRGFLHDAWRGGGRDDSIYSWEELRTGDTKLIRDWVRMMASAGWNAICPSEVNWDYRDNFLDHLDEVEILAGILRDYGMKLYWSPSYLLALDKDTADRLYARVPDFGGYMMKLGSEKQNGDPRPPMANRISDTLLPYGGHVLVRGFVYGNLRYTPEPYRDLIPHDIFAPEDGKFRENVVLVPKGSAGDWDYSAPIPAIDGAMKKTLSGTELVIDKGFPSSWVEKWKWWLEQDTYRSGPGSLNKSIAHCIMGVAMISPAPAWTSSPLNQINYYGLGRLAWNPDRSLEEVYNEWIVQTFGNDLVVIDTINRILFMSDDVARKLYMYRGYRGIWIDKGDENMVENKTPYAINENGIGPASPKLQKRILAQYAPGLREVYGDPLRGEEFLSSFHIRPHEYRLSIGRTLIEDVYGGMEEAVQIAEQMAELWKGLEGRIDDHRFEYTLKTLVDFVEDARGNRDAMAEAFEEHTGTRRADVISRLTASALAAVGTYNVRHFGAGGDGTANDAPAINKAIDACNKAGGGTVFVPSGFYTTGSIRLKSNVTLAIDNGAVLKALPGMMDPWEHNPNDKGLMDPAYYHWEASLIWGKNLENVKIYGPGTLDGTALTRSSKVKKGTGDKGIALKLCKNVEIRNLNIKKGGHYAILATGCENMLVDNVTIKTDRDGLNLSQCKNVLVANCHIDAVRYEDGYPAGGDDAIKLGSDLSLGKALPCENITVRNCFLASGCNTLQFGTETIGAFKNIRFENIRIIRAGKAGISITSNDGSVIDGITYKDINMEKTFTPIFIKISDVARVPEGTYKRGAIRNITFENITARDCFSYFKNRSMPSVIWGKPGSPVENIKFKNVRITTRGGHPASEASLNPEENNERFPRKVGAIPAYACYLRHVKDVRFTGCNFGFEKNDDRPAMLIDDGINVALDECYLREGSDCDSPVATRNGTEINHVRSKTTDSPLGKLNKITFREQPGKIFINIDDKTVATYVYEDPQILRPYFTALKAPSGVEVTRRHPPRKDVDSDDHATMHPGLWLAFGDISGSDFWRNKARVKHAGFIKQPYADKECAGFVVRNQYVANEKIVCEEICKITILNRPAGYLIIWDSEFSSDRESFYFGDQEEMGLGVRLATPIVVKNKKGGRILDDKGNVNEKKIWGKPSLWCDYAGPIDDVFAGVMIMPDPDNFAPCRWHVRDYGFMTANPFGKKAFNLGDPGKVTVDKGKTLRLSFGILLHSSNNEKAIDLDAACKDYLKLKKELE